MYGNYVKLTQSVSCFPDAQLTSKEACFIKHTSPDELTVGLFNALKNFSYCIALEFNSYPICDGELSDVNVILAFSFCWYLKWPSECLLFGLGYGRVLA
jgi:hypothetical protein